MQQVSIVFPYKFQPHQIVFLDHENTRLYSEIIEFVESRQIYWVRPFMLTLPMSVSSPEQLTLYDLRQGADLLWPASLFFPALDTEVIPLFVQLNDPNSEAVNNSDGHKQLSCFVRKFWQAYSSAFQTS
ncbi:MAG: hypothetical protein U7123_24050 [Potamolinea sp.]